MGVVDCLCSLGGGSCGDCGVDVGEVIPFFDFLGPGCLCDSFGGDDECFFGLVGFDEGVECGEGDDGFSESHAEEDGGLGVCGDELCCLLLVGVWGVFHWSFHCFVGVLLMVWRWGWIWLGLSMVVVG